MAQDLCQKLLADIRASPVEPDRIRNMLSDSKQILAKVSLAAMKENSEGFTELLQQSLNTGASWAHQFSRTWQQPEASLGIEIGPDELEVVEPMAIMQEKAHRWAQLWNGT
eukprot:1735630-Pyramimonas_sp.AAC.1